MTGHGHSIPDLIILIKTVDNQNLDFISAILAKGLRNKIIAVFDKIPEGSSLIDYFKAGITKFLTLEFNEEEIIEGCSRVLDSQWFVKQERSGSQLPAYKLIKPAKRSVLSHRE